MSIEFISRMVGMVVLALVGLTSGIQLAQLANADAMLYATVFTLLGALVGLVVTPWVTIRPVRALRNRIRQMPAQQLVAATFGLTVGLIVALLVSFPLSLLPEPYRYILPLVGAVLFSYLGIVVMVMRQQDILHLFGGRRLFRGSEPPETSGHDERYVLLDTSVIIDGRIADIVETGFVEGPLVIPQFVLSELQHIADSSDSLKRTRGRRGLEVLRHIQKQVDIDVRIVDTDYASIKEVDAKLIELAKEVHGKIVTNDSNLNKVAELQGIAVLNINELANSLKPVVLPGEEMNVKILKEGKESGQGVAYLDDGTMIVVDSGRKNIGRTVDVTVTSVLQTPAGRMIFARLKEEAGRETRAKEDYPLNSNF